MKILVVGGGGREHAIVHALAQSHHRPKLYCAPGNPGIAQEAALVNIPADAVRELADFAEKENIDLTVVGPEAPLLAGIVDIFEERGLRIYGPRKAAALIEGSKSFAKDLMLANGVPTAWYRTFTDLQEAKSFVREKGAPIVIKADGLAAGKGVVVAMTLAEAEDALEAMMGEKVFGEAGTRVVIEEYLEGQEATVMAFVDGKTIRVMEASQDHKPVFDGDKGPNTGGMGTYSPVPLATPELYQQVEESIIRPVVDALREQGTPFKGTLYAGLMLTKDGPKVIEFNARFGDPETQVILPRLQSDLVDVMLAVVEGRLHEIDLSWKSDAAVCVIMAAEGYPGSYRKGELIHGLAQVNENVFVYHAGTAEKDGQIVTSGGRVLGVTGFGKDLASAKASAYSGVEQIHFQGAHYRRDIADKAFKS
ncbi:phosphoribosylamine--glycine ligase [Collibacillus ludicampi]|uniref:Phosphoribosylamine--glycine ligase n=1 Tax=Collibacillus ludicampi TaxID=2771369 RepID=A0AAV4LCT2_9BACL|nr:phosphoribosylamine--glycine ligase [Collibacillus ludicampi]GIM45463.1 phosphoribosylamine--glycine ligase [Collibacillus ludicampi]